MIRRSGMQTGIRLRGWCSSGGVPRSLQRLRSAVTEGLLPAIEQCNFYTTIPRGGAQ